MNPWCLYFIIFVQLHSMDTLLTQETSTFSPEYTNSSYILPVNESISTNTTNLYEENHSIFVSTTTESMNQTLSTNHETAINPHVFNDNKTVSELIVTPNRDFLSWIYGIFNAENFKPLEGFGTDDNKPPENCPTCSCGITNVMQRIVGGIVTKIKAYPWMVALTKKNEFYCGASAINSRYLLTAAHCTDGISTNSLSATFFEHDRSDPSETKIFKKKIISILKHKLYRKGGNYDYDIALLKLENHIQFGGEMKPICLPTIGKSFSGMIGKVLGWGATMEYGHVSSKLREVDVPIISNEDCRKTKYGDKITGNMLCAGYPEDGGKDACQGDSGGPLQVLNQTKNMIVGIVSWGEGCALKNYPGVYARVNKFITWIKTNTKDACYCD